MERIELADNRYYVKLRFPEKYLLHTEFMALEKRAHLERVASLLKEIEEDGCLERPLDLRQRLKALERLDRYHFASTVADSFETAVQKRVQEMRSRLEAANSRIYAAIRQNIRQGSGGSSLLHWLPVLTEPEDGTANVESPHYDLVDELIVGVLKFGEPEAADVELTPEMVFYQPTPARHIFKLFERVAMREEDVLIDIGAGFGHVTLLTSICTPARSVGIELEPAYVRCAQNAAESLKLRRITLLQQDARIADFSAGTVFYLYTPFTGTILKATLDRLRQQAEHRSIRVCTFGPCTPVVAAEGWLTTADTVRSDQVVIFQSRTGRDVGTYEKEPLQPCQVSRSG